MCQCERVLENALNWVPLNDFVFWVLFHNGTKQQLFKAGQVSLAFIENSLIGSIPRLVFHNQQALTKFGRSLRYPINWRQYYGINARKKDGDREALGTQYGGKYHTFCEEGIAKLLPKKHCKNSKNTTQLKEYLEWRSREQRKNKFKWRYDRRSGKCNLSNCKLIRKKANKQTSNIKTKTKTNNIGTPTGFEPMVYACALQCFTDWTMKTHWDLANLMSSS